MTDQLALEVEPRDAVRIGFNRGIDVPCPYLGDRARFRPAGGCCKDLATRPA